MVRQRDLPTAEYDMIDTTAMGIKRVYRIQKEKFFPLPDYDLSKPNQVSVTIFGKVLNDTYPVQRLANWVFCLYP